MRQPSMGGHVDGDGAAARLGHRSAVAAPHSLMDELPPRPPSPYKSKQRRHQEGHHGVSVSAAFMRGRRDVRVAAATALSPVAKTSPLATRSAPATAGTTPTAAAVLTPKYALVVTGTKRHKEPEGIRGDEAMLEWLFQEAQRRFYISAEGNERGGILAGEEVAFTNVVIEALQARAELLAGDEAAELVVKEARERAEARRAMMEEIERDVALRLRDERVAQFIAIQVEALLPAHAAGAERLRREEAADLRELFVWHKEHRPLGPGCYLKGPEEDYRLRNISRGTSAATSSGSHSTLTKGSRPASAARSSREYLAELRQKSAASRGPGAALGPLAIVTSPSHETAPASLLDGTLLAADEGIFEAEGRARLKAEKDRRYVELRERREVRQLESSAVDAREYVLAEEAMCWMQIMRLHIDGVYAAQGAARDRKKRETVEDAAANERAAQKLAIKRLLMHQRGLPVPESDNKQSTRGGAAGAAHSTAVPPAARRKSSASTVPDDSSPANLSVARSSGAAAEEATTPEAVSVAAEDEVDLAHLRLITGEIADPDTCKQLAALTEPEADESDAAATEEEAEEETEEEAEL